MSVAFSFTASDAELVQRVRRGDRDAYGTLVQRHQQALYRHARGMGLDHDTSLDLVQDAFVKGYTRIEDCRDPAHARAWLFRIVRNLCLDHLKNVRRGSLSLSDFAEEDAYGAASVASAELGVTLTDALSRLPVALREAFLLKHDAGYSYEEIARMTDTSESAAKMRVHRAREALRALLTDRAVA
ncbi:MAG: RNA polymerase sigma factor [Gemmatimonadota bacterium]